MPDISATAPDYAPRVAAELSLPDKSVRAVLALLADGCTVPFIARYRKEATGSLDEVAIAAIRDRNARICELEKRREAVIASCAERGVLTDALRRDLVRAPTLAELEDAYLPHRPKRRTRGSIARERGLEGLAVHIMRQRDNGPPLSQVAARYVSQERDVASPEEALAGARDIIAESASEHAGVRARMRNLFARRAKIAAVASRPKGEAGETEQAEKYKDYRDTETDVRTAPSHRLHALFRGEREGYLKLRIAPDEGEALGILSAAFLRGAGETSGQVETALKDGYKRLLAPSMETELRALLKERADEDAIRVFAANLHALLMASPYGEKRVLAVDPGFRTGCKLAVLNEQGDLLHHEAVFPHPPQSRAEAAGETVRKIVREYRIDAIAVGNGTAGRETVRWARDLDLACEIVVVNESGASVYSASEIARGEFPDLDVTVRGAVSIGRRLQDPMAELVKIDPKSIGVGQYQHDVDQKKLREALDEAVLLCVNQVGVDLNNASRELLQYVSGLNAALAGNIVAHREKNGAFRRRADLKNVPRLGPKAFEQSAGFLRIRGGADPLDASAVHPENYAAVGRMAADIGCSVADLMRDAALRDRIDPARYADIGGETLRDILSELAKPGRDPREAFTSFSFDESVHQPADLKPGMCLPGIVSNVTDFGVFVDVGVHLDGLLHRSEWKGRSARTLAPGDRIEVEVRSIDLARKRISLGLPGKGERGERRAEPAEVRSQPSVGRSAKSPESAKGWDDIKR